MSGEISNKYDIIKEIGQGSMGTVYLAKNIENNNQVAIKRLKIKKNEADAESIFRFKREAQIIAKLDHPNIIKILDVIEKETEFDIIMEYFDGEDLKNSRDKFSINQKVEIILKCASALDYIHKNEIIHRDIKPNNILVKKSTQLDLRIIDFGLAYLNDISDFYSNGTIMGSMAYIAPEQTGILRRPIDNRSDLYSLGITFYELVTNQLPFFDEDLGKLIHKHLAQKPKKPSEINPKIPQIIDEIILKLLNKEPDKRYQSAEGLKSDLNLFLKNPTTQTFAIASKDKLSGIDTVVETIGRDNEFKLLNESLEKCENSIPSFYLIKGKQGIGKTKIVEDFRLNAVKENITFLTHKCVIPDKNTPLKPIESILEKYFQDKKAQELLKNIDEDSISLLRQIFPSIFGKEKRNKKTEINFKDKLYKENVFEKITFFLKKLCNTNNANVFFLDDIHWADKDTVELLKFICHNLEDTKCFFICTIREENFSEEDYERFLDNNKIFNFINLKPLNQNTTKTLIKKILKIEKDFRLDFYDKLFNSCLGNPLILIENIKYFYNNQVIYIKNNEWEIDYKKLNKIEIENDLTKILIRRLSHFTENEIKILSIASLLGSDFSIDFLRDIIFKYDKDITIKEIILAIDRAIDLQIIEHDFTKKRSGYLFSHDNIKSELYNRINEEKRQELHSMCANSLEKRYNKKIDTIIYRIAYHYNLSNDIQNKLKYNEFAWKKAVSEFSLSEGIFYLKKIVDYKLENKIFDKTFYNEINNLIDFYLYSGHLNTSLEYANKALEIATKSKCDEEKIQLYIKMGLAQYLLNNMLPAINFSDAALSLAEKLGIEIQEGLPYYLKGTAFFFSYELSKAGNCYSKAIKYFKNKDLASLLKSYGHRSWISIMQCDFENAKKDINFVEKNINKIDDLISKAIIYHNISYYYFYTGYNLDLALEYTNKSYELGLKADSYLVQYGSLTAKFLTFFYMLEPDEAIKIGKQTIKFGQENQILIGSESLYASLAIAYLYKGDIEKSIEIANNHGTLDKPTHEKPAYILFMITIAINNFFHNKYKETIESLNKALEVIKQHKLFIYMPFVFTVQKTVYEELEEKNKLKKVEQEIEDFIKEKTGSKYIFKINDKLIKRIINIKRKKSSKTGSKSSKLIKDRLQLNNIIKTSQMISSILDIDEVLHAIVEKTLEVTGAERGALLLYDDKTDTFQTKVTKNIFGDECEVEISSKIVEKIKSIRKGIVFTDSDLNKDFDASDSIILHKIKSIISAPLIFEEKIVGVLYLDSKLLSSLFTDEDLELLNVFTSQAAISIVNAEKNAIIRSQFSDSIEIVYSLIANSTSRVYEHTQETTKISVMLARKLGLNYSNVEQVRIASMLKDVGMLNVMEKVLHGQYNLTEEEKEIYKEHPSKGVEIIKNLKGIEKIKKMILQHQERYDGSGYPNNLKGDEIDLGAKIIGTVDDFVLMLRKRDLQTEDKNELIIQKLKEKKNKDYDPEIIEKLIELILNENLIYIVKKEDINFVKEKNTVKWNFPSNVNFELIVVELIMEELNKRVDINPDLAFSIDYSISEVVRNAIIHGNKYKESKKVYVELKTQKLENNKNLIHLTITDEGEGMNVQEHRHFAQMRKKLFSIIEEIKVFKNDNFKEGNIELDDILTKLTMFKAEYYTDFNTFRQLDSEELSGGIGLLQVISTFDKVEFNNIIKRGKTQGLQVLLEKTI